MRKRARIVLGLFVASIAVVGLVFWFQIRAGEARMRARIAELRAERGCTLRTRIPRGTPIPGDAWVHYQKALETGDLAELALGARSLDLGPVPHGLTSKAYQDLATAVVERGDAGPLLDFTRLIMDRDERGLADRDSPGGWRDLNEPLKALFRFVGTKSLNADEWADLERQFETLDRGFPCTLGYIRHSVASIGEYLLDENDGLRSNVGSATDQRLWRYVFSRSLMRASAFFRYDEELRLIEPLHEGDYQVLRSTCNQLFAFDWKSPNPIVVNFCIVDVFPNPDARAAQARLRLLRAACAWRARGKLPELADPFGTTLQHSAEGARMVIWTKDEDYRDRKLTIEIPK